MDGNYSLSDIAAVTGGRNDGMFGGNGDWGAWIILFLLFGLFGRGGYGGFGGGNSCGSPCATQADVRAAVDQQTLISKLDQQTYGLADSTYALNNTITNGFHGVDRSLCNLSSQLASCCCDIERGIDGVNYNMAKNTCDLQNTMNNNTRDIIDNANCNTRAILDFLTQDKISTLQAENQSLKFQASQTAQNQFITQVGSDIVNRLNPPAIPAYQVPSPFTGWHAGFGFGNFGNCGNNFGNCSCGC